MDRKDAMKIINDFIKSGGTMLIRNPRINSFDKMTDNDLIGIAEGIRNLQRQPLSERYKKWGQIIDLR